MCQASGLSAVLLVRYADVRPLVLCRAAIEAVLSEWFRTMGDLPVILRQAVQMGLFSSQQLVRFCRMDNRPGVARTVARSLPTSVCTRLVTRVLSLSCDDVVTNTMLDPSLCSCSALCSLTAFSVHMLTPCDLHAILRGRH